MKNKVAKWFFPVVFIGVIMLGLFSPITITVSVTTSNALAVADFDGTFMAMDDNMAELALCANTTDLTAQAVCEFNIQHLEKISSLTDQLTAVTNQLAITEMREVNAQAELIEARAEIERLEMANDALKHPLPVETYFADKGDLMLGQPVEAPVAYPNLYDPGTM